jgi:hypothetical protein
VQVLKSIDQTGVPVTLNWQGENVHSTRCGGLVSILGLWLVFVFIVGSLITFATFNQFNEQTVVTYVSESNNVDCLAEGNECQHLNATQLLPFVLIADNNKDAVKVANLSTYLVSEFYVYKTTLNGDPEYTWYDAVPCVDYFTTIYESFDNIPASLQSELFKIHNTTWMCPNIPITGDS